MTLAIHLCTLSSYGFSLLKSFIAINPLASAAGIYRTHRFPKLHLQKQFPIVSQTSQVDQLLTWCSRIHLKGFMSSSSAILSHKCLLMSVIVSFSSTASHLNPVLNHQTKSEFTATNRSSQTHHCLLNHCSRSKMPHGSLTFVLKIMHPNVWLWMFSSKHKGKRNAIRRWLTQENPWKQSAILSCMVDPPQVNLLVTSHRPSNHAYVWRQFNPKKRLCKKVVAIWQNSQLDQLVFIHMCKHNYTYMIYTLRC